MKAILLIVDGLGDLPIAALGDKTPLEAAQTPVLDRLARSGSCGLIDPIGPGITPSTYSGAGMLMGLIPGQADGLGRGPVEAAGIGVKLQPGDIALRANFATCEPNEGGFLITDRRAGRIREGVDELAAGLRDIDLGEGVSASLYPTHHHRAVLVLSGPNLHPAVSDTDPGDSASVLQIADCVASVPAATATADALNRFLRIAHDHLSNHPRNRARAAAGQPPANCVLTRGAGRAVDLDNAVSAAGLSACVISGCNTVKGLGNLFGFRVLDDERFTGGADTDLDAKVAAAITALESTDMVFVHIKAPDVFAHDCDPQGKSQFIEKIDAAIAPLADLAVVVAVTADHSTDSNTGSHTEDPVPTLLATSGNHADGSDVKFGESACRSGQLPRQASHSFLHQIITTIQ